MPIFDEKTRRFAANSLFPSFVYAVLGLTLAQFGTAQMHGSWGLHVFLGIPGIALSGLGLFRARLHWPAGGAKVPELRARALGWYLLLLVVGAFVGALVSAGSVPLLGMLAAFTYLLPWTKIPVCRERFVVSSLAVLAGAHAWVVFYARPAQPLHFMISGWILFVPPMFMHLFVLASLDGGYRIRELRLADKREIDAQVPLPQVAPNVNVNEERTPTAHTSS